MFFFRHQKFVNQGLTVLSINSHKKWIKKGFYFLLQAFLLSLAQLKFDTKNATELLNFHTKVKSSADQFPWNCLIKHLCFYSDQFKEFANSLPEFQSLSSNLVNLKEKMLENSCEMYLHYIFAKYILSTNGIDQLWWLFDGHLEITAQARTEIQVCI